MRREDILDEVDENDSFKISELTKERESGKKDGGFLKPSELYGAAVDNFRM